MAGLSNGRAIGELLCFADAGDIQLLLLPGNSERANDWNNRAIPFLGARTTIGLSVAIRRVKVTPIGETSPGDSTHDAEKRPLWQAVSACRDPRIHAAL